MAIPEPILLSYSEYSLSYKAFDLQKTYNCIRIRILCVSCISEGVKVKIKVPWF